MEASAFIYSQSTENIHRQKCHIKADKGFKFKMSFGSKNRPICNELIQFSSSFPLFFSACLSLLIASKNQAMTITQPQPDQSTTVSKKEQSNQIIRLGLGVSAIKCLHPQLCSKSLPMRFQRVLLW